MAYKRLSELVNELENPQRADSFVKLFRAAVREEKFDAIELPERFTMPKQFARRNGNGESYQRHTKEMAYEDSPVVSEWFAQAQEELATSGRTSKPKLSFELLESGGVDFKALAQETRGKLKKRYVKGQELGKGRNAKPVANRSSVPATRPAARSKKK